jgi:alpha-tubulin suppressor-like RCC1 family protein
MLTESLPTSRTETYRSRRERACYRGIVRLVVLVAALTAGCHSTYSCESSVECVLGGVNGTCEPSGFCAFPDMSCPSGERYEPKAGGGLGGMCAPASIVDGGIDAPSNCGAVGMACCQGEVQSCVDNAFCNGGTCNQCIVDIAIGNDFSCAIKYDGTVWCTGSNGRGQLGNGVVGGVNTNMRSEVHDTTNALISDATAIHAGVEHACVLRAGGAVWCWGKNDDGQVGNNTNNNNVSQADQVTKASDGTPLTGIMSLANSHDSTFGIDASGEAWAWGDNAGGQCGDGTVVTPHIRAAPVLVAAAGAPFAGVAQIVSNENDTVCLRTTGNAIWCWGANSQGEVGDNTSVLKSSPVHVFDGIAITVGRFTTFAVRGDHTVWGWGINARGRLHSLAGGDSQVPTQIGNGGQPLGGAADVVAAGVSCALMSNGDLYCWGTNQHGQTGTSVSPIDPLPVLRANGSPLHGVKRAVAGYATMCAFIDDGELLCWGKNQDGQLGDGTFANRSFPAPIPMTCP